MSDSHLGFCIWVFVCLIRSDVFLLAHGGRLLRWPVECFPWYDHWSTDTTDRLACPHYWTKKSRKSSLNNPSCKNKPIYKNFQIGFVLYLEYAKAFDKGQFLILHSKLKRVGLNYEFHNLLLSYLIGRYQLVNVNGILSDVLPLDSEVPLLFWDPIFVDIHKKMNTFNLPGLYIFAEC